MWVHIFFHLVNLNIEKGKSVNLVKLKNSCTQKENYFTFIFYVLGMKTINPPNP